MQIESQAVESAGMLEQFEGSVAALREIERQYGSLQVMPPSMLQSNSDACSQKHRCVAHDADNAFMLMCRLYDGIIELPPIHGLPCAHTKTVQGAAFFIIKQHIAVDSSVSWQ